MQELYDKLVAMRDRLQKLESFSEIKEHLEEIKLCIQMIDSKSVNAKNEAFCKSIFEDALDDAEKTISQHYNKVVNNTLVRIG